MYIHLTCLMKTTWLAQHQYNEISIHRIRTLKRPQSSVFDRGVSLYDRFILKEIYNLVTQSTIIITEVAESECQSVGFHCSFK